MKEDFVKIVGENNVSSSQQTREQYAHDKGAYGPFLPDLVVWPQSVEQVSEIAKLCNKERIPIISRGTGSGLEGGSITMTVRT